MIVACLSLALALVQSEAKADYDVTVAGQSAGKATITNRITESRGLVTRLRIELKSPDGRTAVVNQESEYAADGKPIRKVLTQGDKTINVVVSGSSARVKVDDANGSHESTVPSTLGSELRAASELWFVTVAPKRGDMCEYHRFDMGTLKWVKTKARYVGEETLTILAGQANCHLVEIDEHKVWIAADGLPMRMQSGAMRLERASR